MAHLFSVDSQDCTARLWEGSTGRLLAFFAVGVWGLSCQAEIEQAHWRLQSLAHRQLAAIPQFQSIVFKKLLRALSLASLCPRCACCAQASQG